MRLHLRRLMVLSVATLATVGVIGVAPAHAASGDLNEDNFSSMVWLVGSDTTYNVMQALGDQYSAAAGCKVEASTGQTQPWNTTCLDVSPGNNVYDISYAPSGISTANPDHDVILNFFATGSGNGRNQLVNRGGTYANGESPSSNLNVRRSDISRSSSAASNTMPEGLQFTAFAKEGQSWITYNDSASATEPRDGVTNLLTQQVKDIWNSATCDVFPTSTNATVDTTNASTSIVADTAFFTAAMVNAPITGAGIPANTRVASVTSPPSTTAVLTQAATATAIDITVTLGAGAQYDWADLGSANAGPIVPWVAQQGSGTRAAWDTFLGASVTANENCILAAQKDGNQANGERVIFENQSVDLFTSTANDCPEVSGPPTGVDGVCTPWSIFHYSTARFSSAVPAQGTKTGVIGSVDGIAPNFTTIQNNTFPFRRDVFNVTRDGCTDSIPAEPVCGITTFLARTPDRQFVDPDVNNNNVGNEAEDVGWLCRPASEMPINPKTGVNYRTEIEATITAFGFVPLTEGATNAGGSPAGTSMCRVTNTENVD